jgi:hypothetical protein
MKEWLKEKSNFSHDNLLRQWEMSLLLDYIFLKEYSLLLLVNCWK